LGGYPGSLFKKQLTESKILLTSTCITSGSDFASWGKLSSKQQE